MISQETYNHYWAKGWAVVEHVFTAEEVDQIAALALDVSQKELETAQDSYVVDKSADGELMPRKIMTPFRKHGDFQHFALDDRIIHLITDLVGEPPLLVTDQIFMKPPRFGSAKPYHQDNFYFECVPGDHVITAWIALDDVDEENGCLRYIDGSHKAGIIPHEPLPGEPYNLVPPPERVDLQKESLAPVGKGGIVFHHSQTLHTSYRNESNRWRRGYATHWASAKVTSTKDTIASAYFQQADYPG
ncbi:MAG: phytanoyl-CoA dioxygenase family protein [Chloroflexota bacterium]